MFIDPGTMKPYVPTPAYFLACFDIYDREETLGEELEKFNPDDPVDREELIRKYCLPMNRSYMHRFLMMRSLKQALQEESYDFDSFFQYDPEAYSSFPDGWDEMKSSRNFFQDIFRLASIEWRDDLQKAEIEEQSL
jgi:hypothetical protein